MENAFEQKLPEKPCASSDFNGSLEDVIFRALTASLESALRPINFHSWVIKLHQTPRS